MRAHQASSTLVRLMFVYRGRSALFVVFLPVIRPSALFSLLISILERPLVLQVLDEASLTYGVNRLIIPDRTIAAARIASRVCPLGMILLLPSALISLFRGAGNARSLPELRVLKLFCVIARFGIVRTLIVLWGDLGPLVPLPKQFNPTMGQRGVVPMEVDLSRHDLPRIALFRRGEGRDLLALTFVYALFSSRCVQGLVRLQNPASRWSFRSVVYCVVLYTLGGDGIADFSTVAAT